MYNCSKTLSEHLNYLIQRNFLKDYWMNGHNTKKTCDHDSQATTCWNSKFRSNPIDCDLKLKLDFKNL